MKIFTYFLFFLDSPTNRIKMQINSFYARLKIFETYIFAFIFYKLFIFIYIFNKNKFVRFHLCKIFWYFINFSHKKVIIFVI